MLTSQRQIYSGSPKVQMPNIIYTYTLCPEGRYIYIIGANVFIRTSVNFEISQQLALWIFDFENIWNSTVNSNNNNNNNNNSNNINSNNINSNNINSNNINSNNNDSNSRIVDFYSLSPRRCVLLMHDNEMKLLKQYLLLMNKETNDTIEILCRNWKIDASEALRVGYGGLPFGYIVVSGYTTPEFGNVLDVRMLPADPGSVTIPAINMDREIARLESLIKQYPLRNLNVWPGSVPLINNKGLYFLLTRHLSERDLCINYVSMLAQRNRTCWMNTVVPSDPTHWRNILQQIILTISRFILLYFGSLFLWLSNIDGGFCAYWFVRIFVWLNGGHLMPNIGLDPSFYILKLDMDCYRLSTKNFQANGTWLKFGGHALLDIMNDGSAVMSELTHECNIIRITEFPSPFIPQTLRRQALNKCIDLYSKLRSSEMLRLECGIADYPEL
ncbi:hypothetical protein DINM_007311 [Dirofilaria immitis]|nr:hypothetical protein [Dirofilaria immitis]